jgi:pimeloyl-ACP methyl ester carboxylesterase
MQTRAVVAKVFYVAFATCFCACLGRAQILISADQEDSIHTGKMHSHVSILGNGHLDATTRSWADNISGFTGSVAVVVLDQSQRLLWVSGTQVCGVSGFSHRTCDWSDTVPADKLSQVRYVAIKHKYTPKREDLGAWLQGLGNDVTKELSSILQTVETAIGATPPPPPPQGTVAANIRVLTPPEEDCKIVKNPQSPKGLLTADYHWPPPEFLDNPKGPEESDGRLNGLLRAHAQMRNAHKILADAVKSSLGLPIMLQEGFVQVPVLTYAKAATALAQLAVTGRNAFKDFEAWHPQDADLVQYVRQANPGMNFNAATLQAAAAKVLDAAYTTLWAIRANDADWRAYRRNLGWIAVSSEDDLPHRPVNTFTAPYPQYDVSFDIPGVSGPIHVVTRYMVASSSPAPFPSDGRYSEHLDRDPAPRTIPLDGHPTIPPQNKIFIYIHGGGSRLEEAVSLADQLIQAAARKGVPYTVISLDLTNSGLSSPFDHTLVANAGPGGGLGSYKPPPGDPNKPIPNPPLTYGYPLMDTEEQYILNFIDAIDRQIGNVKGRIDGLGGGSLGGNMSYRLARRADTYPYLRNIVSWSVTCMQGAQDPNIVGHLGGLIGKYNEAEQPGTRHDFFDNLYNKPLLPVGILPPQPQLWYRDDWSCKPSYIEHSKFDRYEYYTPEFRRWTYRLNYEMTIYSFQEGDLYAPNKAEGPPRYQTVNARMLLASGDRDEHDPFYTLYGSTVNVAGKMTNTHGSTLFMKDTGHSIHDERPAFFAAQIVDFLHPSAPPPPLPALQARACPTADGRTCSAPPTVPKAQEATALLKAIVTVTGNGQPVAGATVAVRGSASVVTDSHGAAVVTYHLFAEKSAPEGGNDPRGKPRSFAASGSTTTFTAPMASISKAGYQSASVDLPDPSAKP